MRIFTNSPNSLIFDFLKNLPKGKTLGLPHHCEQITPSSQAKPPRHCERSAAIYPVVLVMFQKEILTYTKYLQ
jgi:hypothetical protein